MLDGDVMAIKVIQRCNESDTINAEFYIMYFIRVVEKRGLI
jgi:hypothetical protein